MKKINQFLINIEIAEKNVFINGEDYNHEGRKTRKKILEIASDVENGFFVEVGACMGTDTKLLEECGWNGLLIEPSEELYQFCKETRNCIVENYALVSNKYNENYISDIPVFNLPVNIEGYPKNSGVYKAITFSELSKKHNIEKIDIFILDVEGLEIEILNGIDFNKITIDNFIIEHNKMSYSLESLNELMLKYGYTNLGLVEKLGDIHSDYHYKKIK